MVKPLTEAERLELDLYREERRARHDRAMLNVARAERAEKAQSGPWFFFVKVALTIIALPFIVLFAILGAFFSKR